MVKKFKVTKIEIGGKECKIENIQDVFPSQVDLSEVRGGVGKPVEFSKPGEKALMELERFKAAQIDKN